MSLRCMICGKDVQEAGLLERLNDKGKPGVWACDLHWADAKRRHFPDDDPRAPPSWVPEDSKPLGPWTGARYAK